MKEHLIHLLGGFTLKDRNDFGDTMYNLGRTSGKSAAAAYILFYAHSLWGLDKQTWIDKVFAKMESFLSEEEKEYLKKRLKADDKKNS